MKDCVQEKTLAERLKPRVAIEERFPEIGHSFRRKPLYQRKFELAVIKPLLRFTLQASGLYKVGARNALKPVVRHVTFNFPDLPTGLDGFQILQLTDLHIDGVDGLTEVIVPMLRQLKPDLCVLTGDYRFEIEGPLTEVYSRMRKVVAAIDARHGVFGILGNHDEAEAAYELENMGVRMLVNDAVEICHGTASFWLIGVDDPFDFRCDSLPEAMECVPRDSFKVLLSHAPEMYREASDAGIQVYLAGHTHAGQIRFPLVGSIRNNSGAPSEFAFGHWRDRQMHGYTSAGVGCSMLPVRFNCPPEIVIIELRKGTAQVT